VAQYCVRFGLNFSLTGRNVLFCSRRYGFNIGDVLNNSGYVTDTISSYVQSMFADTQMNVVDLLFGEYKLITDGWFCCLVGF